MEPPPVSALPLALATLLGGAAATLWIAWVAWGGPVNWTGILGWCALHGMIAAAIGVLVVLRDSDAPVLRWLAAGSAAGPTGALAIGFHHIGFDLPPLNLAAPLLLAMTLVAMVARALAALVARLLLARMPGR